MMNQVVNSNGGFRLVAALSKNDTVTVVTNDDLISDSFVFLVQFTGILIDQTTLF